VGSKRENKNIKGRQMYKNLGFPNRSIFITKYVRDEVGICILGYRERIDWVM
jgi:hypothetical protein